MNCNSKAINDASVFEHARQKTIDRIFDRVHQLIKDNRNDTYVIRSRAVSILEKAHEGNLQDADVALMELIEKIEKV